MKYYLAVDIGASSGRHILGWVEDGRICLEEVYRFDNGMVQKDGQLCWDIEGLFAHIVEGMKACGKAGKIPSSVGIDTWGVDFVLLDQNGRMIGDPVAYRDARGGEMIGAVEAVIPPTELYAHTGIQKMSFNTIYQLAAVKARNPEHLEQAAHFLLIPSYLHYRLCGAAVNEYTNATTTSLVNAREKTWDAEILDRLGIPRRIFGEIAMPGVTLGGLTEEIRNAVGFDCDVVLPPTHDTGSAFLAVPCKDENAVYLSSGTWSLLGTERRDPILTEESRTANFTNEGGYETRFRYLKNIMGLWMIQSVRRNLNKQYSFAQLEQMAIEAGDFESRVDVNDDCFMAPESMIDAVKEYCARTGQTVPATIGEVMQCIYLSLAEYYAKTMRDLEKLTGQAFTAVNIVGGGSKDGYLNALTAKATGLPVFAGPTEGTALGNLSAQFIAGGEFAGVQEVRKAIRNSFTIKQF